MLSIGSEIEAEVEAGTSTPSSSQHHASGFDLVEHAIDPTPLKQRINASHCGALVVFEGLVRNHNNNRAVTHLHYSAYHSMAIKQGTIIVNQALSQFAIDQAVCVHRIGALHIGDMAIFVGVGAAHRDAAFDACRYILDTVKADVPIWKHEFYADSDQPLWLSNNG